MGGPPSRILDAFLFYGRVRELRRPTKFRHDVWQTEEPTSHDEIILALFLASFLSLFLVHSIKLYVIGIAKFFIPTVTWRHHDQDLLFQLIFMPSRTRICNEYKHVIPYYTDTSNHRQIAIWIIWVIGNFNIE